VSQSNLTPMPKRASKKQALATIEPIEPVIRVIRAQRVILDRDLARIYGVTTARLNQQVNRNLERFPSDFIFQLTRDEFKGRGGYRKLPYTATARTKAPTNRILKFQDHKL
ncbi:MAG TPA: ORF6N domain-containing protein, partial [Pyrinomonadaceae bacterium]